jgi:hypothetical protein
MPKTVFIGSGAGFSGDRLDAALPVIDTLSRRDGPRYLIYEVLAERTLAIAQRIKMRKPDQGYSPYLDKYLRLSLKAAMESGVRIVSNLGAANPAGAAKRVHELAQELGLPRPRIGIVIGDDLTTVMSTDDIGALETIEGLSISGKEIVAANTYLGAQPIADALALGVDIVLVGRTTDAALLLGPLIHEFGWKPEEYDLLATGTLAGHLLECGGQVTGGYFCDPGFKDVPGMDNLGFPIGEVSEDGSLVIAKAENTGGIVTTATVTEQILYEMHDPSAYLTPDVTLDVTQVTLSDDGPDRVKVSGAKGRPPPATLKTTVSADGGWLAEAEMIYAGPNAFARAKMAADIIKSRVRAHDVQDDLRVDIIGVGAVFDNDTSTRRDAINEPLNGEFRVRTAIRTDDKETGAYVNDEVLSLFCSGPAGGGGYRCSVTGQVNTASILVPRDMVEPHVRAEEIKP